MTESTADIAALQKTLTSESDWRKRADAIQILAEIGSTEAVKLIAEATADSNLHVAERAVYYLIDREDELRALIVGALDGANEEVIPRMLWILLRLEERSVLGKIEKLIQHPNADVSKTARIVFGTLAPRDQAVPYVLEELGGKPAEVTEGCIKLAGKLQITEAVPLLQQIMLNMRDHVYFGACRAAAQALGVTGSNGVDVLLEESRSSDDHIRENAVWGLGASDDPRARERLVEMLNDKFHMIAAAAVHSLKQIGHPELYSLMLPLLDVAGVNQSAIVILGETGDLRAAAILIERLRKGQDNADRGLYALCLRYWDIKPLEMNMTIFPEIISAAKSDPDKYRRIAAIWVLQSYGYEYYELREKWYKANGNLKGIKVPAVYH